MASTAVDTGPTIDEISTPGADITTSVNAPSPASTSGPQQPPPPSLRPSLSWKSVRSSLSVSERTSAQLGWAVAFLSVLFTVVALSPAFKSQSMTQRALELAEWTALKDFIEECREEIAAGVESRACRKAMDTQIPPPPHMKSNLFETVKRELLKEHHVFNETKREIQGVLEELPMFTVFWSVGFVLALAICVIFVTLETRRTNIPRTSFADEASGEMEKEALEDTMASESIPAISSTTIRHPPPEVEATLRRRAVRTHPIYRHSNLDEAIHAADLSEIRMRLQNGEDVNQHWPYLIYRLAISPRAPDMAKRIEVARLCLDFGADVNALKGWNGQSALLIAIHFGNVDVARLLIANGAMVGYSPLDSHLTALHRCVRLAATGSSTDALAIMEMLFEAGANANQMDRLWETPLHKLLIDSWYARNDNTTFRKLLPIALCLVEHGARMPTSLNPEFIFGNPLDELVQAAIRERTKRISEGREFKREWQLWTGLDDGELMVQKVLQLWQNPQSKQAE